jgi:hypothetical protein
MNEWSGAVGAAGWIGGFVLLAVIIWAWLQNRKTRNVDRAERGARDLREQLNAEDTGQAPRRKR